MFADQRYFKPLPFCPDSFDSFREYLAYVTETLAQMLEDRATKEWDRLTLCMTEATVEQIGAEMSRWWKSQIRAFHNRLRLEHEQDRSRRLRGRLKRAECRRTAVEDQLKAAQQEVNDVNKDLEIERGLTAQLKERLCRHETPET